MKVATFCGCGHCSDCQQFDEEYTAAETARVKREEAGDDSAVEAEFAPTKVRDGDLLLCGRRGAVDECGYRWLEDAYGLGLEVESR